MKEYTGFHAEDAEFANRVRESFERQGLMKHLGAELVELTAGHATIRVPFSEELTQQHNYFHAGVSGAIADSACGYAAYTLMPADSSVLTVEYKLNLLAPADGEELTARARVIRSGRTLKVCAADVHAKKNGEEVTLRNDAGDDYVFAWEAGSGGVNPATRRRKRLAAA